MAWVFLFLAGVGEIVWAVALKFSEGFTKPVPGAIAVGVGLVSFYLLALAVARLPLGNAYAIWTGIGALGTTAFGILLFGESRDPVRLVFVAMIVAGIVGLKFVSR
jgi:quaternary ammonium compound-resistance protein SugE